MIVNIWYLPESNEIVLQHIWEYMGEKYYYCLDKNGPYKGEKSIAESPWVFIDHYTITDWNLDDDPKRQKT